MFCAFTDKCCFLLNLHDHYIVLSVLCCIWGSVIVSLFVRNVFDVMDGTVMLFHQLYIALEMIVH